MVPRKNTKMKAEVKGAPRTLRFLDRATYHLIDHPETLYFHNRWVVYSSTILLLLGIGLIRRESDLPLRAAPSKLLIAQEQIVSEYGTGYGQGYPTGYLSPDVSASATQLPDASTFPGIPDQFSTLDYNNSVYGSFTISPTDYSYPSFTSNYDYSNFPGGSGLCSNDTNDFPSLYPRNWDENSTDASFGSNGGYSDCSSAIAPSAIGTGTT